MLNDVLQTWECHPRVAERARRRIRKREKKKSGSPEYELPSFLRHLA